MSFIEVDLTQTPDKFPQLEPGVYTATVKEAELKPNKKGTGNNLVVKLEVKDNEKFNGMSITDYLTTQGKYAVGLKHFVQSCGLPLTTNGLDVSSVIGKTVKIRVTARTYTDESGVVKESVNVGEYMH